MWAVFLFLKERCNSNSSRCMAPTADLQEPVNLPIAVRLLKYALSTDNLSLFRVQQRCWAEHFSTRISGFHGARVQPRLHKPSLLRSTKITQFLKATDFKVVGFLMLWKYT